MITHGHYFAFHFLLKELMYFFYTQFMFKFVIRNTCRYKKNFKR